MRVTTEAMTAGRSRRVRVRLTVAALGALALAACSSDDTPSADTAAAQTSTSAAATTSAPATTSATPSARTAATTAAPSTSSSPASTAPAAPRLEGLKVAFADAGSYDAPIVMAVRPGANDMFIGERAGRVKRVADGKVVLDVVDETSTDSERGLLGLAFAPGGAKAYVSYTDNDGDSRIDEYSVAGDGTFEPSSARHVLFVDQPFANHNGGDIAFGPDGYLYFGLGDGGSGGDPKRNGFKGSTLLAKLLRIDPSKPSGDLGYAVPADNPFVGQQGVRPEIWAAGLRNPWRWSFDSATGDLWIGDVGQGEWEEVDVARATAGKNAGRGLSFGWSAFEGTHRYNDDQPTEGQTPPILEYRHGDDGCSITGGYVYRGSAIPDLRGAYVYGDYCSGKVWAIAVDGTKVTQHVQLGEVPDLVSFGQDPNGELYALSLDGPVRRLAP
jgi:glucose/arabinose dehydrogenase